MYITAAGLHAAAAALFVTGTVADPGLIAPTAMNRSEHILGALLVQSLLGLTFLFARSTRAAMFESVSSLHAAALVAAQREVVVGEAVDELQRAAVLLPGRLSGTSVGGFALGEVIGRGGMGEIYRAVNLESGATAAVKVLHPMFGGEPLALERFTREARHAGSLDTPHVVRVLDAGEGTEPYMAMELLSGQDLGAVLRRRHTLTPGETRRLVRHIARGLDAAAAVDIVHRDIKPQNLFRAEQGGHDPVWKILDFGIARLSAHGDTLTQNTILGTPSYIAPEVWRGEPAAEPADIWALGVILYIAATGQLPYGRRPAHELLEAMHKGPPARPSDLVPSLPATFDDVLAGALALDATKRTATARAFIEALRPLADPASDAAPDPFVQMDTGPLAPLPTTGPELRSEPGTKVEQGPGDPTLSEDPSEDLAERTASQQSTSSVSSDGGATQVLPLSEMLSAEPGPQERPARARTRFAEASATHIVRAGGAPFSERSTLIEREAVRGSPRGLGLALLAAGLSVVGAGLVAAVVMASDRPAAQATLAPPAPALVDEDGPASGPEEILAEAELDEERPLPEPSLEPPLEPPVEPSVDAVAEERVSLPSSVRRAAPRATQERAAQKARVKARQRALSGLLKRRGLLVGDDATLAEEVRAARAEAQRGRYEEAARSLEAATRRAEDVVIDRRFVGAKLERFNRLHARSTGKRRSDLERLAAEVADALARGDYQAANRHLSRGLTL